MPFSVIPVFQDAILDQEWSRALTAFPWGLVSFFSQVVMSTYLGFRKPDPRIFMIACTLLNTPPEDAVYIGNDPEADIGGAKGIGMQAILLDRKGENANTEPKPDFHANNLWEAWGWIKNHNK